MSVATNSLDSGITVVTEHMPDVRSVAVGFWVGTGSRDESTPEAGASHFLEHLLFKGTADRSARDIAEAVDAVGGDINAFTTKEYTAFYVRLLSESLDLGLDVLSDIMWAPSFRPEEVEAERQVILEEISMRADEPADLVHELFTEALYPGHPLGRDVLGDEGTIAGMARGQIADFHAHHYRPGNIVVAAAGDLDHDKVAAGLERRFAGRLGGAGPQRSGPQQPPQSLAIAHRPTEQAHIVVGVAALDRDDDDRYALAVLNHVVGGGMSSRLFQEIRETRGLAYSVYSYRASYEGTGAFAIYAGTGPGKAREVIQLMHAELDRVVDAGITDRELTMAKSHLRGSMALSLEDSGARMSRLGRSQLVHGRVQGLDEVDGRLGAVTLADVGRVARSLLGGRRVLAVVGPFDDDDFVDVVR
ncbi:MAG TPA: pitrilysin family protein [Acidimicrobiales bacterium]|nr:pitrilysin family protein [Acidimicrobiales bacterium]